MLVAIVISQEEYRDKNQKKQPRKDEQMVKIKCSGKSIKDISTRRNEDETYIGSPH